MTIGDRDVFSAIYDQNVWRSGESASGRGSTREQTQNLRRAPPRVLNALDVTSLVGAPRGDFNRMQRLGYALDLYVGVGIVPALFDRMRTVHGGPRRRGLASIEHAGAALRIGDADRDESGRVAAAHFGEIHRRLLDCEGGRKDVIGRAAQ